MSLPGLVFPSDFRSPLDDSRIRKVMKQIVKKAEVRQRKSVVHVLRSPPDSKADCYSSRGDVSTPLGVS